MEERKQDVSAQADPVREQGGETDICKSFTANHRPIPLPRLGRAAVGGRLCHVLATRARAAAADGGPAASHGRLLCLDRDGLI